jgi:AraC family transcriptional regulator of adaptative response / DNA-3-methyladenine glycosylase II
MIGFLRARAIPRVERVEGEVYRRAFLLGGARGTVEVAPAPGQNVLLATIHTDDVASLASLVARLRHLFDLDVDAAAVDAHLGADPRFARDVRARPGVRVPGAWDSFELAVRAILGQQISVAGARTFAGRIAEAYGEPIEAGGPPDRVFPGPDRLAKTDLTTIGLTGARASALQTLSAAMASDPKLLRAGASLDETLAKLVALPGIGPWTAGYIAMRALREPDAFPVSDLGLLRAMTTNGSRPAPAALERRAEAWRPWRAYAAARLWSMPSQARPARARMGLTTRATATTSAQ